MKFILPLITTFIAVPISLPSEAELSMDQLWGDRSTKDGDETSKRAELFRDGNHGMFIHWGLYSHLGGQWKDKTIPTAPGSSAFPNPANKKSPSPSSLRPPGAPLLRCLPVFIHIVTAMFAPLAPDPGHRGPTLFLKLNRFARFHRKDARFRTVKFYIRGNMTFHRPYFFR